MGLKRLAFVGAAAVAAALDLWSKSAVFAHGSTKGVVPGVLDFETARNPGIAWSLFAKQDARWILAGVAVAGLVVIATVLLRARAPSWRFTLGLGLIAGGTLGNLHDRIVHGAVRDFLRVAFIDFPIFNVADSFVFIGAALLLFDGLFARPAAERG